MAINQYSLKNTNGDRPKNALTHCLTRLFIAMAAMVCLCGNSGCMLLQKIGCWQPPPPRPSVVLAQNASLDDVINAVNNNNAKKQRLIATNARISIEGAPMSLSTDIAYEYPKKYRATGEAITSREFDIGSNEELFWVWFKLDPRKAMYFSRHDQYAASPVRDSFQITPDWFIEAMGMTVFQPTPYEKHELVSRTGEGNWKIKTERPSPLGTYTKYTTVDGRTACVLLQELYNPSGRMIASAVSPSHALDPTTNITYPETVDMTVSMQGQQVAMRLSMGNVQFNQNNPFFADAFSMPSYPDTQRVDIAAQPISPGIQQVSGSVPVTNTGAY